MQSTVFVEHVHVTHPNSVPAIWLAIALGCGRLQYLFSISVSITFLFFIFHLFVLLEVQLPHIILGRRREKYLLHRVSQSEASGRKKGLVPNRVFIYHFMRRIRLDSVSILV